jgi:hypothetical protein
MHAATLLLPILAVLAQAAPPAAPKGDDHGKASLAHAQMYVVAMS